MDNKYKHLPSFGRRRGRKMSSVKQELLGSQLSNITIKLNQHEVVKIDELFASASNPIWMEIGFGNGEFLAAQALANQDINFIGCEPYINGVANFLKLINKSELANIRIWSDDARILLDNMPDCKISRFYILFPDPWPKAKHHKRRLINSRFLSLLASKLVDQGLIIIATDHEEYASYIQEHFAVCPQFVQVVQSGQDLHTPPAGWIRTRYQSRAESLQMKPYFLVFQKS